MRDGEQYPIKTKFSLFQVQLLRKEQPTEEILLPCDK